MNPYFSMSEKIYDITERYPALIPFLAGLGFEQLKNDSLRRTLGRAISLEMALKGKKLDLALTEQRMVELLDRAAEDPDAPIRTYGAADNSFSATASGTSHTSDTAGTASQSADSAASCAAPQHSDEIRMEGLLPCPVRVPVSDALSAWANEHHANIHFDMQAASMGIARMKEHVDAAADASGLADLYLSAGYGLFFDQDIFSRFPDDTFSLDDFSFPIAARFDNETLSVRDPKNRFQIIGMVPAVFAINLKELDGRAVPESWSDLMKPEYEDSAAIPVQDADLFDAIMLSIWERYGDDGLRALGRSSRRAMHPAQMVKAASQRSGAPLVSIVPYFFAQMMQDRKDVQIVWPKDGAILNPIFVMAKKESLPKTRELLSYLTSSAFGDTLSAGGRFPSTHANAAHPTDTDKNFLWPGFALLNSPDIPQILKHAADVFLAESGR